MPDLTPGAITKLKRRHTQHLLEYSDESGEPYSIGLVELPSDVFVSWGTLASDETSRAVALSLIASTLRKSDGGDWWAAAVSLAERMEEIAQWPRNLVEEITEVAARKNGLLEAASDAVGN